tara:strand:- start:152 stop:2419 length:2268 start_codon:yes stop_codon:yes gene_type:complete
MKRLIFFLCFCPIVTLSQNINHWETAIFDFNIWSYLEGNYEPDSNWRKLSFNDSTWLQGQGGIGYGDGDDSTITSSISSLYLRKIFNIVDTSEVLQAILNIDYDDAFVAYLNNVEIARSNIGLIGDHPQYNQLANFNHEAQMYQGGNPEQFLINIQLLKDNLLLGDNVLAIQVHNIASSSSDLSSRIFFSLAIDTTTFNYSQTPIWFQPPVILSSSNLPIVIINTNGQNIVDDPRIICDLGIIDNGFGFSNYITDSLNDYNGKISIELRGSSSQSFPKKSYAFETQDTMGNNNNVSILDLPVENDWILYAPYSDKSLMRNFLTFNLGRKMGNYSSRTVYCELVIDGNYQGIYILMEKIKRDNDRIDIARLDSNDISGDSLTGGYIIKIDKFTGTGGAFWTSNFPTIAGDSLYIQYHYPEASIIAPQQKYYIKSYIDSFENILSSSNFTDSLIGYRKYINVNSFIDLYIINELSKNIDGYRLSTYMYKDRVDRGGRLKMGPFWDYNLSYGNADYCDGGNPAGWEVNSGCGGPNPFWFERLLDDPKYQDSLKCRWVYLRQNSFHQDSIFSFIDSTALYLNDAQQRNFQQWNILGNYIWPNFYIGNTYQDELAFFKTWISSRLVWIDNNILGNCDIALGCTDILACNYDSLANTNDGSCNYNSSSYDTIFSSINIIWNGMLLSNSGDYTYTLLNSVGCDSIINLNFIINSTGNINISNGERTLVKITDLLGRATRSNRSSTLLYIYNDGTVEKKIIIH